jgi:maleate isomerase
MIGWRARLGFLLPPGNPTVEPEMMAMAPEGVSLHFDRMVARGTPGAHAGSAERNRMMLDNIDASIEMLALVKPDVIALAHTASSYDLGRDGEAALIARLEQLTGTRVVTAFGSVVRALQRLGVTRLALGPLLGRDDARSQTASRKLRLSGRQFRQSEGRHEHLRRDRRARLSARPRGRR